MLLNSLKMNNKKLIRMLTMIWMCVILFLTSCSKHYEITDLEEDNVMEETENLFTSTGELSLGFITHEATKPNRNDKGDILPFQYEGEKFSLDYKVQAEGRGESIGFLLFIDGISQPYTVEDNNEYEYCHIFKMDDVKSTEFTFNFFPVEGKEGDTLSLTVVSIYNPSFQPDMKDTSSYGWYHSILENKYLLHFDTNVEQKDMVNNPLSELLADLKISSEKITEDFLKNKLTKYGWDDVAMERLNQNVYYLVEYNGTQLFDNLKIRKDENLHITYKICGAAGIEYKTTFFVDHQPISIDAVSSSETRLTKGDVWIIDAIIDVSKLSDFSTFYVVSVPTNTIDNNVNAFVLKSKSLLLYKE